MKRCIIIVIITLIGLFFTNCSLLQQVESRLAIKNCKFRIANVRDIRYNPVIDPNNLEFIINMECKNPNREVETILDKITFDLYVNDNKTTSGSISKQLTIEPLQVVTFPITVGLNLRDVSTAIFNAISNERADYRIEGTAFFNTPIGEISFPVTIKEGSWSN
ncbi:LEA type 2 family protein [bacterium]|nr:LEA type 2 family protein [bacterium]